MPDRVPVRCCIAGGGPAGMMLGLLLARAGVDVLVLEKHADFLRDFRGDTIHPSTLEVIGELGLLDELLALPHQKVERLAAQFEGESFDIADFRGLPVRCPYLMFLPQWDFLDFLARQARRHASFELRMRAEVQALIEREGRVVGVLAQTPAGRCEIAADLVIAADGRHSTVRSAAGLATIEYGAPIDVLWFRLPRAPSDRESSGGHIGGGRFLVTIDRGDFWQCGYVVAKGGFAALQAGGLGAFKSAIASLLPKLADAVDAIDDWGDVKLLTVQIDRMPRWWRDGLLCIGDAAHAMSPVGGVGINLAIQDAVAAANLLAVPLAAGRPACRQLEAVQLRREWPARLTQAVQVVVQNRILAPLIEAPARANSEPPLALRLLRRWPALQRIPARWVGIGVRPEHVAP